METTTTPATETTPRYSQTTDQATASSAHSRLNIPLNLDNWKTLDEQVAADLLWFHQHALDEGLSLDECGQALNYDGSTIFRALKGTYEGNWSNIQRAIRSYRKLHEDRGTIQNVGFCENSITRKIFAGLNYAMAANSITVITGESRSGKTESAVAWRDANNHGRSVYVVAPAYGGTKALLREIAKTCGINKNMGATQMHDAVIRAFNRNRMLIVDEAHRLLPCDRRSNPVQLEVLRDIHDRTGCGLALLATARFDHELERSDYMHEQLRGRIGMPVKLSKKIKTTDIEPIVRQYIARPTIKLMTLCEQIANEPGRLGILVELLRVASRMAAKEQKTTSPRITEQHMFRAAALRRQMSTAADPEN